MIQARQALYGERNKGHALLACTPGSEATANAIRAHTDRAADRPSKMELPPYLTGLRVGNAFAVMRTTIDPEATRRGMVLTHALFVPVAECASITDIGSLIEALPSRPVRAASLEPISLNEDLPAPVTPELIEPLLAAFLAGAPLVAWLGEDGFENAVRSVWRVLGPSERASFAFGFAFGPKGALGGQGSSPVLMRTPSPLRSRWTEHVVLDPAAPTATGTPSSSAVAAILNRPGGEAVRSLQQAMETDELALSDYRMLEIAAPRFSAFEAGTAGAADLRTLARAVGRLAPRREQATALKRRLLVKICESISQPDDVLGLRNLDLTAYSTAESFWSCVAASWASSAVDAQARVRDDAALVIQAFETEDAEWAGPVLDAASSVVSSSPSTAWSWWAEAPQLISALLIRVEPQVERALVKAAPTPLPAAASVRDAARERGLLVLHAHAVADLGSPSEAFAEQLALGNGPNHLDALRHLAGILGPGPTIQAAVQAHPAPPLLLQVAASAVQEFPEGLKGMDPADPAWRAPWAHAVQFGANVVEGVGRPTFARDAVLDALADQSDIDAMALADAFSYTGLANLLGYPNRMDLWPRLKGDTRGRFLDATVVGWVADAQAGGPDWSIEPEVLDAAIALTYSKGLFDPLRPGGVAYAAEAFSRSNALSEQDFTVWVRGLPRGAHLSKSEAERIGSVARARGWRRGAQEVLASVEWERRDLLPALGKVLDLLGDAGRQFAKLIGVGEGPTSDDWWGTLDQLARELLTTPDLLDPLWERAGGEEGDLQSRGTNASRTTHAVGLVRKGNAVTPTAFVRALRSEYPENNRLNKVEAVGRDLGIVKRTK